MVIPIARLQLSKSLADIIREKLDAGTLPHDNFVKLWAGLGSGNTCSACGQAILPSQTELEPQYDDGRPEILLHLGCHGLWEAERRRRRYQRGEQTG